MKIKCCLLLLMLSLQSFASDELVLGTVEISAPSSPIIEGEIPDSFGAATTEVGAKQMESLNAQELAPALKRVPGLTISRYDYIGSFGGADGGAVYIRGQGVARPNAEIKIYQNGAPRETGTFTHPILDILNTGFADNIKIYKGPQPHATAGNFGAIDVNTAQRKKEGFETKINLMGGSYSTWGADLKHGGKIGAFDYYVGGTHKQSHGHREHSAGELESQYARLGYDLANNIHLSYIFDRTDNFAEDPGQVGGTMYEREVFNTRTIDHLLRLDNKGDHLNGYALMYFEDGEIHWPQETGLKESNSDWENYGLRTMETYSIDQLDISAGVEFNTSYGKSTSKNTAGATTFSFDAHYYSWAPATAIAYHFKIGPELTLTPSIGMRYYDHSKFKDKAAPHAGLLLQGKSWLTRLYFSKGVHYPGTVASTYSTEDSLKPEYLDHIELGFSKKLNKDLSVNATVFYDDVQDRLVSNAGTWENTGTGEVYGIELSGDYNLNDWARFFASTTLLKTDPDNYPRSPEMTVALGSSLTPIDRLTIDVDLQYVGSQYKSNPRYPASSAIKVGSHALLNSKVSYLLLKKGSTTGKVYLALANITDADYEYLPNYPMPGMNIQSGLNLQF